MCWIFIPTEHCALPCVVCHSVFCILTSHEPLKFDPYNYKYSVLNPNFKERQPYTEKGYALEYIGQYYLIQLAAALKCLGKGYLASC